METGGLWCFFDSLVVLQVQTDPTDAIKKRELWLAKDAFAMLCAEFIHVQSLQDLLEDVVVGIKISAKMMMSST